MISFARSLMSLSLVFLVATASSGKDSKSGTESNPQPTTAAQPRPASSSAADNSAPSTTSVNVTINVFGDRHAISPYVYGGAYPQDLAHVTDSGTTVVRWGGNGTSTYNWKLFTDNAANDYYFEDYAAAGFGNGSDADSAQFVKDVIAAGSHPLMTMVMLPWVAQSAETSVTQGGTNNYHWSYSVATFGSQCSVDPYNIDAGDGLKTDCSTPVTTNPATTAYFPLLDQPGTGDPPNSVYRNQWAAALAAAFGAAPHFYDMDNEIDIWGSTHRDIHPNPSGYDELANTYLTEAVNLKTWDPQAIRFGPVSCCWWYYWNGENNNDKGAHAGVDFLPWWLNQVYWHDKIAGQRSVDVLDVHAYPDSPDTSGWTQAQIQALAARVYRDYWDPTYVSESSSIDQPYTTYLQPNKTIPFRIPRIRAIANMIYPGTQVSFTEWNAAFAGESDFSTALGDADAYGILGRERMYLATRWVAPVPTNPNYLALKLFTNYQRPASHLRKHFGLRYQQWQSGSFQQLCGSHLDRHDPHSDGAEQRSSQHRAGAIRDAGIHAPAGDNLHTLFRESHDDRRLKQNRLALQHVLRSLFRDPAGSDWQVTIARRNLDFKSRHHHGRRRPHRDPSSQDHDGKGHRVARNSTVGQWHHPGRFAIDSDFDRGRGDHRDCRSHARLLPLHCSRHRQHRRRADAEWMDSCRQSSRLADQDRRQPERCGGKQTESFSDAQSRPVRWQRLRWDNFFHYHRRFALQSHGHDRFLRQGVGRADSAVVG